MREARTYRSNKGSHECRHNKMWSCHLVFTMVVEPYNSVLLRKYLLGLTTREMGSELRYGFWKVFGTQNRPTLRLVSSHCVLCLTLIKGTLNIASILTLTLAYI